ncbi:MAG: hypothetical protein QM731_25925 [Chitinophagaceae bacterium]
MFNPFKKKLPDCDGLFKKYLSPWYPENERPEMTRPDMYQIAAFEGEPLDLDNIQYLAPDTLEDIKKFINETMVEAALDDFQNIIPADKLDLSVLDAVDKYYDRKRIAELIKQSDPEDFSNCYLVTVCEFGVMLGHLFKQIEGFDWLYSYPYFHSIIVHKETGFGITVFDWAVKKFSEYGVDDGFVAKFHAAIDGVNGGWEDNGDEE